VVEAYKQFEEAKQEKIRRENQDLYDEEEEEDEKEDYIASES
jgi:hypothetical protein